MKEKILALKTIDDLEIFEEEYLERTRNEFYNKILADKDIKKHILELFNQKDDKLIDNILMINGSPPVDDFTRN